MKHRRIIGMTMAFAVVILPLGSFCHFITLIGPDEFRLIPFWVRLLVSAFYLTSMVGVTIFAPYDWRMKEGIRDIFTSFPAWLKAAIMPLAAFSALVIIILFCAGPHLPEQAKWPFIIESLAILSLYLLQVVVFTYDHLAKFGEEAASLIVGL